jgi:hypothetical protein
MDPDLDGALSRLQALLRPRVGKKMTALVVKNMLGLLEQRAPHTSVLHAIQQTIDAYARLPESGTPFPLDVARTIGDAGCLNLAALHWKLRWHKLAALSAGMTDEEVRAVGAHADALLPSYGDDDAEFALRVAWRCSHHGRLHLVVGRALNANDPTPTVLLHEAWQRQGAPDDAFAGAPIGVVPADIGTPGVIYALPRSSSALSSSFVFSPDHGDNIPLDDVTGLQRFLARVPLAITPRTLAWLVHLVRIATMHAGDAPIDVDTDLLRSWEEKEQEPASNAASLLLGIPADPIEERASLTMRAGGTTFTYVRGEVSTS